MNPAAPSQSPPTADPAKSHLAAALKHESPLVSCRYDPSGRFIFFGAQDNRVWRWDGASEQALPYAGHDSWVRAIGFHPSGGTVITGGYDGRLIWWPVAADQPRPERVLEAHQGWIRAVAVSPDGELIATVGNDLLVKLWRFADGALQRELAGHESHIYNVAFHPAGAQLVSGDLKCVLRDWEISSGTLRRTMQAAALYKYDQGFRADIGGPRGMAFDRDGQRLACAGITEVTNAFAGVGNPAVEVLDWESGEKHKLHRSKGKLRGVAWGVAYHPQGFLIAVSGGGGGGFLLFWHPDQEEEFHQFKLPNTARDLSLAPDGLHVATAHYDGHLRVVRLTEPAE